MKQWWQVSKIQIARLPVVSLAVTLVLSTVVLARAESQPPSELERLEYFEGTWSCQQPAGSNKPSGQFTWHVEKGLNDFWYLGDAEQTLTPEDGKPINSQEFLGYDLAAKKLVRSVVVGNGNAYNLAADDWQDNKLVWEGTIVMQGKSSPLKSEIIQDSQDKFTATYFALGENENWIPVVNESCDRNKP